MKNCLLVLLIALSGTTIAQNLPEAIALIESDQSTDACEILMDLIQDDAQNAEVNFWLGVAFTNAFSDENSDYYNQKHKLIDAGIAIEKSIFLNGNKVEEDQKKYLISFNNKAYNNGVQCYQAGDVDLAFTFFKMSSESSIWLGKKDEQSNYFTAHCANKLGDFHSAVKYLNLIQNTSDAKVSKEVLKANIGLKEYEKASLVIDNALAQDENSEYFWHESLSLSLQTGDLNKALEAANNLNKLDVENTKNLSLTASIYDQLGDKEMAIETYKKSLSINPDDFKSNFNLGVLFYNTAIKILNNTSDQIEKDKALSMLKEAKLYLTSALTIKPDQNEVAKILENIKNIN